jgi:hypothetical protein
MYLSNIDKKPLVLIIDDVKENAVFYGAGIGEAGYPTMMLTEMDTLDTDKVISVVTMNRPAVIVLDRRFLDGTTHEKAYGGDEIAWEIKHCAESIRAAARTRSALGNEEDANYSPFIILATRMPGEDYNLIRLRLIDQSFAPGRNTLQDLLARIDLGVSQMKKPLLPVPASSTKLLLGTDGSTPGGWIYDSATGTFHNPSDEEELPDLTLQRFQRVIFDTLARYVNQGCSVETIIGALEAAGWDPDGRDARGRVRDAVSTLREKLRVHLRIDKERVLPDAHSNGLSAVYTLRAIRIP